MLPDLSTLPPVLGAVIVAVWFAIQWMIAHRERCAQRWAGTVHAAIQMARSTHMEGPGWLNHLEASFERAYEKTHGKKPHKALAGRGVADMANLMSNHMLQHHHDGVADDFRDLIVGKKDFDPLHHGQAGPTCATGPMGNPGIRGQTGPEQRPLRRFSTMGILILAFCGAAFAEDKPAPIAVTVEAVAFAPNGSSKLGFGDCDCTATVVDTLSRAKKTVIVQAYNFTSVEIADALIAAHKRGVKVSIIGDRSVPTERSSKAEECAKAGIAVTIDKKHHIAHNKVIVIDDEIVITGSFNWTDSAENNNAENLLVLKSIPLAAIYTANWKKHAEHAEALKDGE